MTDTTLIGLPEAAHRLGVSLRILRRAIFLGRLSAPAHLTATTGVSADWLAGVQAKLEAEPKILAGTLRQKVPAFARFEGTSAWQKFPRRARAFARSK